jgi:PAS domain S-box-containing protein
MSSQEKKLIDYQILYDNIPSICFTLDQAGVIASVNKFGAEYLGYTPEELISNPIGQILYSADQEKLQTQFIELARDLKQFYSTGSVEKNYEDTSRSWTFRQIRKNGSVLWVKAIASIINSPDSPCPNILLVCQDLTEYKQIEVELRSKEQELTDFFENGAIALRWVDANGYIMWANQAELDLLGYTREEYIGRHITQLYTDKTVVDDIFKRLAANQTLHDYEAQLLCKDGSIKDVLIDSNVYWANGKFIHTRCFTRDITQRKRAKEELLSMNAALDHAGEGISRLDLDGRYVSLNQVYASTLGYQPEEMIGTTWERTVHPEDLPDVIAAYHQMLQQGKGETEARGKRKDGSTFHKHIAIVATYDSCNHLTGHYCFMQDITARKQVEEALRHAHDELETKVEERTCELKRINQQLQQEIEDRKRAEVALQENKEQLARIFETVPNGIALVDPGGKVTFANAAAHRILGWTHSCVLDRSFSDPAWQITTIEGKPLSEGELPVAQVMQTDQPVHSFEQTIRRSDRTHLILSVNAAPFYDSLGKIAGVVVSFSDITERKQEEEERQKLVSLINHSQDFIAISSLQGKILFINEAGRQLVGLDSLQEAISQDISAYFSKAGWVEFMQKTLPELMATGRSTGEAQLRHFKSNQYIDVHRSCFVVNHPKTGEPMCLATVQRDITERKLSEAQLRKLSSAVEQSADSVVITNKEGVIEYVNPTCEQLTGYTKAEALGKTPRLFKSDQHSSGFYEELWSTILSGQVFQSVFANRKKNGKLFYEEKTITPIRNEEGKITHFVSTGKDITERRRVEEKLIRIGKAIESVSDAIGMADTSGISIYHNKAFLDLFGMTVEELNAAGGPTTLYSSPTVAQEVFRTIQNGNSWSGEVMMIRRDGTPLIVSLRADAIKDEEGKLVGLIGVHTNITEQKKAEQQIKASLKEKEVLLQEIHHRVKNNLQIISSLLSIQSEVVDDEQVLDILRDSQNRVQSMALIHERLYQSQDMIKIEFSEYVQSLAINLFHSYDIEFNQISLELETQGVSLSINTAIPCGLIINELVSNAIKYAFPNKEKGSIYISISKEIDKFILVVKDDGIGLPENLDLENSKTLGLRLVDTLVQQIRGTMITNQERGAFFEITFSELV